LPNWNPDADTQSDGHGHGYAYRDADTNAFGDTDCHSVRYAQCDTTTNSYTQDSPDTKAASYSSGLKQTDQLSIQSNETCAH